jgi:hypothetical protein
MAHSIRILVAEIFTEGWDLIQAEHWDQTSTMDISAIQPIIRKAAIHQLAQSLQNFTTSAKEQAFQEQIVF